MGRIAFTFTTRIQTPTGALVTPFLEHTYSEENHKMDASLKDFYDLKIEENGKIIKLGLLQLVPEKDKCYSGEACLRVSCEDCFETEPENMQYKKVRTALLEYALSISLENYSGKMMVEAFREEKRFFEESGFRIDLKATEKEYDIHSEIRRGIWSMSLPAGNIDLLKARFNADPVVIETPSYVILESNNEEREKKRSLILEKGGEILSEEGDKLRFKIKPDMLKQDKNNGIRDRLGMFRVAMRPMASDAVDKRAFVLMEYFPEVTVEKQYMDGTLKYLMTGDQKWHSTVAQLVDAADIDKMHDALENILQKLQPSMLHQSSLGQRANHSNSNNSNAPKNGSENKINSFV
jgi:hypothetical protein